MGDIQGPPPSLSPTSNLPMLYYSLVVVGTAAIVLAIYNLIVIRWCTQRPADDYRLRPAGLGDITDSSRSFANQNNLLSSFKYKKECCNMDEESQEAGREYECAVCLSAFEDGEEVRQLPRCNHSFHAPCIDMWLYSHFDCPLCRASVDPSPPQCHRQTLVNSPESS